jgi:hypothetical protein
VIGLLRPGTPVVARSHYAAQGRSPHASGLQGGGSIVVAMIYLVVGLDQSTLTPWYENVRAVDAASARRIACARAQAQGIDLAIGAVIGSYSSVVADT